MKIDWIEIGLDKWQVKPRKWAKLVEKFCLSEKIESDTYCAWNEEKGIFITGCYDKDYYEEYEINAPSSYGALDFAPKLTIKDFANFLDNFYDACEHFEMDLVIGVASSDYMHPPKWLQEIMRKK